MSQTFTILRPKTMAFGGVPEGNMNANEAEKVTFKDCKFSRILMTFYRKNVDEWISFLHFGNCGDYWDENGGGCHVASELCNKK